jgi:AraC-like DNA-binding protein
MAAATASAGSSRPHDLPTTVVEATQSLLRHLLTWRANLRVAVSPILSVLPEAVAHSRTLLSRLGSTATRSYTEDPEEEGELAVVVDTSGVPCTERFELWTDAHQAEFPAIGLRSEHSKSFIGRMWRHDLGPLSVHRLVADASAVRRTPTMILCEDPGLLQVTLLVRGRWCVTQDGRTSELEAGDLTSYASWRPFEVRALTPFEMVLIGVPEALLRPHAYRVIRRTALRVHGDTGAGRIMRQYLQAVMLGLEEGVLGMDPGQLAESTVDLVRALHLRDEPAGTCGRRSADALVGRIRAFIELHLGDPDLSRDRIAREHFISKSYLDKLFEAEGTSVWQSIKQRRLDRCRRDLQDERLADESILEIASRWGFTNAAHFSRTFAAAFGMSPSEFRRTSQASRDQERVTRPGCAPDPT